MCFQIAAKMHLITVAEHLGVRLPASPPPGERGENPAQTNSPNSVDELV